MVKAKFVVYYHELDKDNVKGTLRNYIALFSPDVEALKDALLQVAYSSPKITVVKTPKAVYVAPGEYELGGKVYEFLVSREGGLKNVAEEILGVKKSRFNTVINVVQAVLWGVAILLGYFGYKNDALNEVFSYVALLFLLSGVIENFKRGYKKRKRVRASAPRHTSE
ncbi:hypothetical protein [Thermococcus sp.]|uniref:hypothetical protein n=1 Tax=Thermococcus sp. TaxID=35749 RepID=UPI002631DBC5|nr:hypothetical protein [Thermococcus sp.]